MGSRQDYLGWRRLEKELKAALRREEVPRNAAGLALLFAGLLILAGLGAVIAHDRREFTQSLFQFLENIGRMLRIGG